MRKKRIKKLIILITFVCVICILLGIFLSLNKKKTGGYLIFSDKYCTCDQGKHHKELLLMFDYDSEQRLLKIEFHCSDCQLPVAVVNISSYPSFIDAYLNLESGTSSIDLSKYVGSEPRIFDEIKKLSNYSNIGSIVYQNSKRVMSVLDIYEFSDWTKDIINALGTYVPDSYQIVFDPNGGTGIMDAKNFMSGYLPECHYMKEGYLFSGWSQKDDGTVEFSDCAYVALSKNVTLYAIWEDNPYDIIVTSDDESYGIGKIDSLYGRTLTISAVPTYGHKFTGWYDKADNLLSSEPNLSFELPESDIYYNAKFDTNTGMVRIIDGGTNYIGDTDNCIVGTSVEISSGLRPGYDFNEWNITRGSVDIKDKSLSTTSFTMPEGDVVLTATWKEIKGIEAEPNSTFTSLYNSSEYYNGTCYDIDKGITVKNSMVSVYVLYSDDTRRQIDNFTMNAFTLCNIGSNNIPIQLTLNDITYNTELIIQGYSSTLYKLMIAAGIDADTFQQLTILISKIQNGLIFVNNSITIYQNQLDDLRTQYNSKLKDRTLTLSELSTIHSNMETLAIQCSTYEADISSVSQQTRLLINNYKGINNQAISDAFVALATQIKSLTSQILTTSESQQFLLDQYNSLKNTIK